MKKNITINSIRNIGISAHIDAGKTTTTERILFYTGINHKIGEVHEGKATMDWMDQEQERGITITSAATTVFWSGSKKNKNIHKINIIDTPGHVDFTIEVERSMRIIDGVCMLYCAVGGVQSQSETVWKQSVKHKVSKIIFINKMDRIGSNFYKIYEDLKLKLKANPVPIYIPYFLNNNFSGVIDLISFKLIIWKEINNGMFFDFFEIPEDYFEISCKWRNNLIEKAILDNDIFIEKYLNNKDILTSDILTLLREKTIKNKIQPMLCGTSLKNKGVQCLLDAIVDFLPSPEDSLGVTGYDNSGKSVIIKPSENEKFIALAFKVVNDPFIGQLIFFRVYSGKISCGSIVYNASKNKKERLGRILRIHANKKEDIKFISMGDIAAAAGLKSFYTGDTLNGEEGSPVILEKIFSPDPVISQSLTIKNKSDEEKIFIVLEKLNREDPSFKYNINNESNQIIISGMGELHLEVLVEKIRRENNIDLIIGKPKVSYRETIKSNINNIEGKYIRQSGGRGQYGHVIINLESGLRGSGFKFINNIKSGSIPKEYIPCIKKSIEDAAKIGVIYGYPVIDIIVILVDGSYHDVDSSENSFKIASNIAFREAFKKASPILLEPIMLLHTEVPSENLGSIISDLSSKRSELLIIEDSSNDYKIIKSNTPLSEMFNYSTTLRSMTKGRGFYNMAFNFYSEVSQNILKNFV
ncbi:elongation factor G [Candidatus Nasuia deltocephalinicola]|uniref:elongation factor G n=1 Tax=Candidatus Nasuia deltocephalincola TaxID=1160784 RepID=UPI00216B05B0|nr:elongation factor G [Candidatus Nasuia deltocephalinicola]